MQEKKIAVITGGSGGIGFQVALKLGADGYDVALLDRNDEKKEELLKELASKNIKGEFHVCDVTNEPQLSGVIQDIGTRYGKIDTLINNAGGLGGRQRFEVLEWDFIQQVLGLNLYSVLFAVKAAIPFLKKSSYPSIVNYGTIAVYNGGGSGAGVYAASKAAVSTLTIAMAKDLGEYGIRVNAVAPGTIDTPFHAATNKDVMETWKNGIVMKRFGQPSEVASVVGFLVSKDSSFITGEIIQINGGQGFVL